MNDHLAIRLAGAVDVVAAVPHYIGFHPTKSLIIICVTADESLSQMIRVDVGPDCRYDDPMTLHTIRKHGTAHIILVVVDDDAEHNLLPHEDLVHRAHAAFEKETGNGVHALWASSTGPGATVRCYADPECGGTISDVPGELAVLGVLMGKVVYGSRDDVAALFEPTSAAAVARRSAILDAQTRHEPPQGADLYASVLDAIESPPAPDDDDRIARLGMALADYRVRDAVLPLCLSTTGHRAEQLWILLARELPAPERAEAATLVAFAAWMHGTKVLANVALEVALAAQPGHDLALTLRAALSLGVPREAVARPLTDAAKDALRDLESD